LKATSLLKCTVILLVLCVTGIALGIILPLQSAPLVGKQGNYFLSDVKVIDTISGGVSAGMTVVVERGRISAVLPDEQYQPHPGITEIPAKGKYVLPGLWDMHTHSLKLSPQLHHPLFIRYGVTSIRDMSGCLTESDSYWACPADRRLWERQAINGERVSPRYPLQSSYQTNGGNEVPNGYPDYFRVASAADARELVDFYVFSGIDFIKIYSELSAVQYDLIAENAASVGLAIAGHKPFSISLLHALETGMESIEHGRLFMFECFAGIEQFRLLEDPASHYDAQFMREMLENQNSDICDMKMGLMAHSGAAWVPTLTTLKMSAMSRKASFRDDTRLEYIPLIVQKLLWGPDISRASGKGLDKQGRFVHADFYSHAAAQVGIAQQRGIRILAGTDNIDTYVFTGSSLHDELGMLVDAGLTPLEAIQSATIMSARYSGMDQESGSVEAGKQADLLLLNSNPLDDIANTTDIFGVMFAGHYFDQKALAALDGYAVEMAGSFRVNVRFLFDLIASPLMRAQLAD
jgi:amidohydrolase family protein